MSFCLFRLKVRYVLQHQVLAKWPPKDGTVYSTPYTLPDQSSSTTTTTEQSISPEVSTSAPQQEGDNENEDTLSYSLVSSDGVYTAEAGDSHTANYSMNSPSGTSLIDGVISDKLRREQTRSFRIEAINSAGSAYSEWIKVVVSARPSQLYSKVKN